MMTRVMVVDDDVAKSLHGIDPKLALGRVYRTCVFVPSSHEPQSYGVAAFFESDAGKTGGPVEQSDLRASPNPVLYRARRALLEGGLEEGKLDLRDVSVQGH